MKLYLKNTKRMWPEIRSIMDEYFTKDGWQSGSERLRDGSTIGYVEVLDDDHPNLCFLLLQW